MNKFVQIFRKPDIRNKVLFILGVLVVYRLVANVPVPFVDAAQLQSFFANNQFYGLLSALTGGSLSQLSIAMLALGPYISASIIMQLLTMIFPSLEEMYKREGEAGRAKFNQYSRVLTVPLAAVSAFGFLVSLQNQNVIGYLTLFQWATVISVVVAGSVFLMWLGELVTEKNIGNGVSILILAGIVAGFPVQLQQALFKYDATMFFTYLTFVILAVAVIAGVVYISEAQRNIPVNYARRVRGSKVYGGVSTYLPMRINNAGVMPIIFAISLLLFPGLIAGFFANTGVGFISNIASSINSFLSPTGIWYSILYFLLVVVFTYFYTAITFDPKQISEDVQKQGGYIPGIRPGPSTAQFLYHLLNRVTLVGAIFLGIIAILPNIVQYSTSLTDFAVGGTSILIVVSVALEVMKQLDAQLAMYEY
ncbi:MAG: Protein translocase subunit SecY [Candidatus Yanofskybacteria bacterium GW2011_GWA1_48_10]|uniref:Protein translocase subunit SecY n=2 Tax=Candidatus Yanofskyibacteriota TaxID=1752733 RepID=A0A0G1X6E5_9BACT|nr:MAG: Protein translocase subunit SecY [Candidatus Yanofskybacteria bacterium GW2011_GWA1_48_10]OGN06736.1 MAG: preprotein translocase subunit SecY [Candidatus Yanofskybacteria bacterium RIFCSPHIGHO2_01_FULL_48_25b]